MERDPLGIVAYCWNIGGPATNIRGPSYLQGQGLGGATRAQVHAESSLSPTLDPMASNLGLREVLRSVYGLII